MIFRRNRLLPRLYILSNTLTFSIEDDVFCGVSLEGTLSGSDLVGLVVE